jgi:hypothetical protein
VVVVVLVTLVVLAVLSRKLEMVVAVVVEIVVEAKVTAVVVLATLASAALVAVVAFAAVVLFELHFAQQLRRWLFCNSCFLELTCRHPNIPSHIARHGLLSVPLHLDTGAGDLQHLEHLVNLIRKRREFLDIYF